MKHSFTAPIPSEWFDVATVCRILDCTPARVLELVTSGILDGRNNASGEARISSASLDRYTASRPLVQQAPPPTYVRHGNGYRLEV
jgi:hypothetical protein